MNHGLKGETAQPGGLLGECVCGARFGGKGKPRRALRIIWAKYRDHLGHANARGKENAA